MIAKVASRSTRRTQNPQREYFSLRSLRALRSLRSLVTVAVLSGQAAHAHDFERTQVMLTFAPDGSFVLDVTNDAAWLEHRLIPFRDAESDRAPSFADRVVLFVDGVEVRPASVERLAVSAGAAGSGAPALTIYRMRGRLPATARSLRWYYGLPIDPYPLTLRRADGRIDVEEIAGDAWSRPIDLSGQFRARRVTPAMTAATIALVLLLPLAIRFAGRRRKRSTRVTGSAPL